MPRSRCSLALLAGVFIGGLSLLPRHAGFSDNGVTDDNWCNHPALAEPDGESHRGDKMVAAEISDPRVLAELIRRFHQTKPMVLAEQDGKIVIRGAEDFERRQEYFLRLLDYYWFSKHRLIGMTWAEIDHVFGPLGPVSERAFIRAGRDTLCLWFTEGSCSGAFYAMGY